MFLRNVPATLRPGDIVDVRIEDADAHDLYGVACGRTNTRATIGKPAAT